MKNLTLSIFLILLVWSQNRAQLVKEDFSFSDLAVTENLERLPSFLKIPDREQIIRRNKAARIKCQELGFTLKVDFFRTKEQQTATAFIFQADYSQLVFVDMGGVPTNRVEISAFISGEGNYAKSYFRVRSDETTTMEALQDGSHKHGLTYVQAAILPRGNYKVVAIIRDIESGCQGLNTIKFVVPPYETRNRK